MGRLKGKSALVTAAGQGIGRASAIALANEGAEVLATDINKITLNELDDIKNTNISTFQLDVLDDKSVKNCINKALSLIHI